MSIAVYLFGGKLDESSSMKARSRRLTGSLSNCPYESKTQAFFVGLGEALVPSFISRRWEAVLAEPGAHITERDWALVGRDLDNGVREFEQANPRIRKRHSSYS